MRLSKSEEQLMNYIWKFKISTLKKLVNAYPEPKPAITTVATLLKRMQDKKYVGYTQIGRSRKYFPIVKKEDYFSNHINDLIKRFFNDSAAQFASFFTKKTDISKEELKKLKALIDSEIKKK